MQSVEAVRRERPDVVPVVLRRLKALVHISAVPIIVVSGRAADTDRDRMLDAGGDVTLAAAS